MPFHVMLIPTLGCPANCSYCWSSEEKSPIMSIETIKEVVEWLKTFRGDSVTFTFHGGEPLLAGAEFYREAFPLIVEGLSPRKIAFAIQTNLWRMTPEIAEIFAEYRVPIGSSLDGPKELNDSQRGKGYYDKTMRGYEIAKEQGLDVRFITTFTSHSVKYKEDIFNFYLEKGFTLKLHPCLPSLKGDNPEKWTLDSKEYGELLIYLLDKYLENLGQIDVMNIDHLCKCVFTGRGTVCTYVDCMGDTFAVGPEGNIYPCYRFVGMPEYVMGNVYDRPTMADLAQSEAWKQMHKFKEYVDTACGKCAHIKYCRGGCPYNAIVPTNGEIKGVDPHCPAYKMIFDEINNRVNEEMFGDSSGMDNMFMSQTNMFMPQPMKPSKPGIMSLMLKKI
jgi:uncharacterized protein